MPASYSIRAVAEETGISEHTLRAWERRYGIPKPLRTDSNRRVYGEADVRRLKMLRRALEAGHSIGLIASLSDHELQSLAKPTPATRSVPIATAEAPSQFVELAMAAMSKLDPIELEQVIVRATFVLGVDALIEEVIVPLMSQVGQGWIDGGVSIAQEHLATALVRTHLERTRLSIRPSQTAPKIVVATPAGQHHEVGAMLVAMTAARMGWNVTYLGPNLPAAEVATAATELNAVAVGLSLVYPADDSNLPSELIALRKALPYRTEICLGGESVTGYSDAIAQIGAVVCPDLRFLRGWLTRIQSGHQPD